MLRRSALIALVCLFSRTPALAVERGHLVILHMNVGQGDATLIVAPSGETILFDGGDKSTGRKVVTARLRTLGYQKIDYVIASHYDADHIGGLDDAGRLMREAPMRTMDRRDTDPGLTKGTQAFKDYTAAFSTSRDLPMTLGPGLFEFASDLSILVTSGNGCVYGQKRKNKPRLDENATSLSLVLNYGTFDYFIGGDLTGGGRSGSRRTTDLETPTAQIVSKVDVLRVNHHGSETSSNAAFLEMLDPKVAIISVGNGGSNKSRFHHPRRSVLDRLHDIASTGSLEKVYLTNRGETDGGLKSRDKSLLDVVDGDIAIVTNGEWFLVNGVAYHTDLQISGATRFDDQLAHVCEAPA